MSDIALVANVTRSTVSLALRHNPRIPEKTRTRILGIARSLGYQPDPLLDAFNFQRVTKRPSRAGDSIAFLTDLPSKSALAASTIHNQAFEGAKERATQLGMQIDLFFLGPRQLTAPRLERILKTRRIHSIIIGALCNLQSGFDFDWTQYCIIAIDSFHIVTPVDIVTADFQSGIRNRVRALQSDGHERIGFATSTEEASRLQNRPLAGYLLGVGREGPLDIPPLSISTLAKPDFARELNRWAVKYRLSAVVFGCVLVQNSWLQNQTDKGRTEFPAPSARQPDGFRFAALPSPYRELGAHTVQLLALRLQTNQRGVSPERTVISLPVDRGSGLL